jgi:hypothetical protein
MLLRREVQHPLVRAAPQMQPANINFLLLAQPLILLKHLWENRLEILGDALSHYTNDVHRVHQHFGWRMEQVSNHIGNHNIFNLPGIEMIAQPGNLSVVFHIGASFTILMAIGFTASLAIV